MVNARGGGGRGSAVDDVSVSPSIHGLQHSKSFGDSFGPTTHDNAVLALRMQAAVHRDMTWQRRIFGIGPKQLHLPRSRMIHPSSPFAQGIAITSSLLLVYSAIVTPVLIGFFTNQPECLQHDTLVIDMFADVFFLLEILVALCTGATVDGEYCDEWRRVWWRYLTTNLLFDCCTSIPVAWIEWAGLQQCRSLDIDIQDGHDTKGGSQALKVVRIVKPLRLFKLLRVLKAMKILQLLDDLESYLRLPPFMFRMVRVLMIILYAVHVTSCTFWLVKENTNGEEEVREWFAALLDHPDEDSDSLYHKYVVSFYFINTIFSTVGFGDIVPGNSPERLFVVGAFYLGTIVFGTLLSEVENAVAQLKRFSRSKSRTLQELRDFLRSQEIPASLERKVIKWVEFDYSCKYDHATKMRSLEMLPPQLQHDVLMVLNKGTLNKMRIFRHFDHKHADLFILDLYKCLDVRTFPEFSTIAMQGEPQDGLYIVHQGVAQVSIVPPVEGENGEQTVAASPSRQSLQESSLQKSSNFRSSSSLRVARKMERRQTEVDLMELKEGDMFGECSLLANRLGPHSVGSHWDASIVSITHVQAFHLNQETFAMLCKARGDKFVEGLVKAHQRCAFNQFLDFYRSSQHMKTQGKSDGGGASAFTVEEKWANLAAGLSQTLYQDRIRKLILRQPMDSSATHGESGRTLGDSIEEDRDDDVVEGETSPRRDYNSNGVHSTEKAVLRRMSSLSEQIQHLSSVVAALAAAVAEDNGASGAHTARGLGEGMLPRASRTCAGVLAENHQAAPPVRGNAGPTAEERVAPGGGNGAGGNDGCDADNRLSTSDSDDFREDVSPDKEARSGSIDLRRRGRRPPPNRSPLALRGNLSGGARSGLSRHHGGGLGRNGGVIGVRASRGGREELGMEDESASVPVLPQVEAPLESAEMGPRSASPGQVDVVDA